MDSPEVTDLLFIFGCITVAGVLLLYGVYLAYRKIRIKKGRWEEKLLLEHIAKQSLPKGKPKSSPNLTDSPTLPESKRPAT